MPRIQRHVLSKSEARDVASIIDRHMKVKVPFNYKLKWEIVRLDGDVDLYLMDGKPIALRLSSRLIPSLKALLDGLVELPKVIVDLGAVKHILNGADVMAPGVVGIEGDFNKGDLVVVVDEKHKRPLCVGMALLNKLEVIAASKGKVVENLHYVGDKLWNKMKNAKIL